MTSTQVGKLDKNNTMLWIPAIDLQIQDQTFPYIQAVLAA